MNPPVISRSGVPVAILQREACHLGLILQTNGRQTIMDEKVLTKCGFVPVSSSYKEPR